MPERVGDQVHGALALEDEQREVVGERVRERDRDQGVGEALGQLGGGVTLPHAHHAPDPQPVEAADDQDARDQSPTSEAHCSWLSGPAPRWLKTDSMWGASDCQTGPFDAPSKVVEPIATASRAIVPGQSSSGGAPDSERTPLELAVATREHREPCEEAEVDAERIGPLTPGVDAEPGHAAEHHHGVDERHDRELRGVVAVAVGKLDEGEAEDADGRRPATEPGRVLEHGRGLAFRDLAEGPGGAPGDRAPRAEQR